MIKKIVFFCLFTPNVLYVSGQGLSEGQAAIQPSAKLPGHYRETLAGQSLLFQGREYTGFDKRITGHAFFLTDDWVQASILYGGILYLDVPLLYDIVRQEVIVGHPNKYAKIKLVHDQVSWFSFSGHTFIHISEQGSNNKSALQAGLYEKLYDGNLLVLAKREKFFKSYSYENELIKEFVGNDSFYIKKDDVFHAVKSKQSVLRLLKDQKKEIRRFLRKNKIKYRNNEEAAMVKMVEFYESGGY